MAKDGVGGIGCGNDTWVPPACAGAAWIGRPRMVNSSQRRIEAAGKYVATCGGGMNGGGMNGGVVMGGICAAMA